MSALLGAYGLTLLRGNKTVLSEVSFELNAGECLAVIGPNGAGKTTLLHALAGFFERSASGFSGAFSGLVRLNGHDCSSMSAAERAGRIAYVGSELNSGFPLTALEIVELGRLPASGARPVAGPTAAQAMQSCGVWHLRDRDVRTLSGGERQRVSLSRALAQNPRVLLLDESLSKMDLQHQAQAGALIRSICAEGRAVVWVAHDLNLAAEWADHALLLRDGKILAQGSMQSVLTGSNLVRAYDGIAAAVTIGTNPTTGRPKVFFKG